jgi:hypothetical protein
MLFIQGAYMKNPTHKQKLTAVLWVQGFTAKQIGVVLRVSPKAIHKRIGNIKRSWPEAYHKMHSMRHCFFKQKQSCKHPRLYAANNFDKGGFMPWWNNNTGEVEDLKIVQKF